MFGVVRGRDKAKAECDRAPYERIWVTVESDDFKGTVALNLETGQSLLQDLESCIEDIRGRKPHEKVKA
jgi:hypothetical protein